MTITDLTTPEYPGPGIGITDACGLCGETFDLMYPADQYPTLTNDMGDPEELICDACQDLMEDSEDVPAETEALPRPAATGSQHWDWMADPEAYAEAAHWDAEA